MKLAELIKNVPDTLTQSFLRLVSMVRAKGYLKKEENIEKSEEK